MGKIKISDIFASLSNILQAYIQRVAALSHLASLEAKLAIKTLIEITALLFVLSIVLISSWLSILFLIYKCLLLYFTPIMAASSVVGINLILFITIVAVIFNIKKNLSFPVTRKHLQRLNPTHEELTDEQITSKN